MNSGSVREVMSKKLELLTLRQANVFFAMVRYGGVFQVHRQCIVGQLVIISFILNRPKGKSGAGLSPIQSFICYCLKSRGEKILRNSLSLWCLLSMVKDYFTFCVYVMIRELVWSCSESLSPNKMNPWSIIGTKMELWNCRLEFSARPSRAPH